MVDDDDMHAVEMIDATIDRVYVLDRGYLAELKRIKSDALTTTVNQYESQYMQWRRRLLTAQADQVLNECTFVNAHEIKLKHPNTRFLEAKAKRFGFKVHADSINNAEDLNYFDIRKRLLQARLRVCRQPSS